MSTPRQVRWETALALSLATVLGLLFWHSPVLYPLKLLAVTLHEAGHAVAAWGVGGHATRISISRYEGGIAHLVYPASWWRQLVVGSAGYLGTTIFGVALLRLAARPEPSRGPRLTLWILSGGLLLLALLLFRDLFSWLFALPTAAALGLLARRAPDAVVRPAALFTAAFACLYALFDLRDDVLRLPWEARPDAVTDADLLARALLLPALFWAVLWSALAVLLVGWTVWSLVRARPHRPTVRKLDDALDRSVPGR